MTHKTLHERAWEHAPKHRRQLPGFVTPYADAMHQQRLVGDYLEHLGAEAEADTERRVKEAEELQAAMSSS